MIISWDWQKGTKLASSRGHRDQIFCIKWRPLVKDAAVTVGVRHIKFWEQAGSGFTAKRGVFGKAGKLDTMLSIEFGANGEVYTGAQNGKVYVWDGNKLVRTVALHTGPVFALFQVRDRFVSGGKDGIVKLWSEAFEKCEKEYVTSPIHCNGLRCRIRRGGGPSRRSNGHVEHVLRPKRANELFPVVIQVPDRV
jgi:microtubule-associated protein-like 6